MDLRTNSDFLPYTELREWFCIAEVEGVYCAVRAEFL
jgi:hypothetical protein